MELHRKAKITGYLIHDSKTVIVEWIEVFYNRQRIHSTIGYLIKGWNSQHRARKISPQLPHNWMICRRAA
jgi:hypothetical protein